METRKVVVRLELAEDFEHPHGDARCGYEFGALLDESNTIDVNAWQQFPEDFPARRFWAGEKDQVGRLVRIGKGNWHFHYRWSGDQDDPAFLFDQSVFAEGKFVSIRDHADKMRTFRIVSVREMEAA